MKDQVWLRELSHLVEGSLVEVQVEVLQVFGEDVRQRLVEDLTHALVKGQGVTLLAQLEVAGGLEDRLLNKMLLLRQVHRTVQLLNGRHKLVGDNQS